MAQTWTTTELLADIRAQMRLPDDDPDATNTVLLAEATRQLHTRFVPLVRSVRAEYYQVYEDQDLVVDQAEYDIPHRAATSSVREVLLVDGQGSARELYPAAHGDRHAYTGGSGPVSRYTIVDDQVILMPAPSTTSETLRIVYELRPSSLILPTACDTLDEVNTDFLTEDPAYYVLTFVDGNTWTAGTYLDIIRATPPFSVAMLNCTWAETLVFGLYVPDATHRTPRPGDYICNSGESPVPQIPAELHPILAKATAAAYLSPIDGDTSKRLSNEVEDELAKALRMLAPRQQGKSIKVKSRTSAFRRGRGGGGGSFGDWT